MFEFTEKMLKDLFYENDSLSLTRVIAFGSFASFTVGSFYMLANGISWPEYGIFATYTGGGGIAMQFGNKFINSKYNSLPGSYEDANHNNIPDKIEETVKEAATNVVSNAITHAATNVPAVSQAIDSVNKVGQVINTVQDSSTKIKEGLTNLHKLVRK